MSATGPCATILSERAALALEAAGAEGLRELEEPAEVPDDTEVEGVVEVETFGVEVVITEVGRRDELGTEVVLIEVPGTELVLIEVGLGRLDETWMGPGP